MVQPVNLFHTAVIMLNSACFVTLTINLFILESKYHTENKMKKKIFLGKSYIETLFNSVSIYQVLELQVSIEKSLKYFLLQIDLHENIFQHVRILFNMPSVERNHKPPNVYQNFKLHYSSV